MREKTGYGVARVHRMLHDWSKPCNVFRQLFCQISESEVLANLRLREFVPVTNTGEPSFDLPPTIGQDRSGDDRHESFWFTSGFIRLRKTTALQISDHCSSIVQTKSLRPRMFVQSPQYRPGKLRMLGGSASSKSWRALLDLLCGCF